MSEIRIDPFSGREIIISTRTMRNSVKNFTAPRFAKKEGSCAFCSGQEKETLPEIFAIKEVIHLAMMLVKKRENSHSFFLYLYFI